MKTIFKVSIIALASMPVLASAQIYLYIPSAQDHFDVSGQGGGGPFNAEILSGPSKTVIGTETMFCDSIPQEFYLGQTFEVTVERFNSSTNTSLDPWVITHAGSEASSFDAANNVTLSQKQINSAIQGVIWSIDGQTTGTITSSDAGTASFANYLLSDAHSKGTFNVGGYARFDAGPNYANGNGVFGQSQIGMAPVPEPASLLALGLPVAGLAFRKRRTSK